MEDSAAEGGAWGIALLAAYMLQRSGESGQANLSLEQFLAEKVFAGKSGVKMDPQPDDVESFNKFMKLYITGLKIEKAAVENF
jgi:hypothetical protein